MINRIYELPEELRNSALLSMVPELRGDDNGISFNYTLRSEFRRRGIQISVTPGNSWMTIVDEGRSYQVKMVTDVVLDFSKMATAVTTFDKLEKGGNEYLLSENSDLIGNSNGILIDKTLIKFLEDKGFQLESDGGQLFITGIEGSYQVYRFEYVGNIYADFGRPKAKYRLLVDELPEIQMQNIKDYLGQHGIVPLIKKL